MSLFAASRCEGEARPHGAVNHQTKAVVALQDSLGAEHCCQASMILLRC